MERRVIIIISIVVFIFASSAVTEAVRLLDTLTLDQCGKELCLTVRTDREIYTLREYLSVDVFLSNNGVKDYHGLPSELDMEIYNASQALMRSRLAPVLGEKGFTLVRGRKVELNAPLSLPLNLEIKYLGDKPFHSGVFTIILTCYHLEYVLEGNTTFTIL